jgi:hypothetical protein
LGRAFQLSRPLRVLVDQSHDTLVQHFVCDYVGAERYQFFEHKKHLFVLCIRDIIHKVAQKFEEEVLNVQRSLRPVLFLEMSHHVRKHEVEELHH